MMRINRSLFAEHAYLPDGWRRDVLLEWDTHGMLSAVTQDAPEPRDAAPKAAGPLMPGMPNLHSHAFQRAMAGRAVQLELSQITWMEERAPYAYDETLA